mgnify:CR=1 FL=1
MSESYRTITTKLRDIRPKAIFVDGPAMHGGGTVSIPRSLIHGGDDLKFDRLFDGDEVTFRVMSWKAEDLGFA